MFRRRRFFKGDAGRGGESERGDIVWFLNNGEEMADEDWDTWFARSVMVYLNGDRIAEPDPRGNKVVDDDFLIAYNASEEDLDFVVPETIEDATWEVVLSTDSVEYTGDTYVAGDVFPVKSRSVTILVCHRVDKEQNVEVETARTPAPTGRLSSATTEKLPTVGAHGQAEIRDSARKSSSR